MPIKYDPKTALTGMPLDASVSHSGQRGFIKSIQYGTVTVVDNVGVGTATITSVVTSNSLIFNNGFSCGTNTAWASFAPSQVFLGLTLTNSTTITAVHSGAFGAGGTVFSLAFCVVEFYPGVLKSVQRGTITFGTADLTKDATITTVNTNKTILQMVGFDGGAASATTDPLSNIFPNLTLLNATTVRASRQAQNGVIVPLLNYQVVEFY